MRPRFLADADLNSKIVIWLRRQEPSIDFLSAHKAGLAGLTDAEIIAVAAEMGRVLVSHDQNTIPGYFARFCKLRSSAGVIIVPQSMNIGLAINDLFLIWFATDANELIDQLRFIPI